MKSRVSCQLSSKFIHSPLITHHTTAALIHSSPRACSRGQQRHRSHQVVCQNNQHNTSEVVQAGDTATIHFTAYGEGGQRLESTRDAGQALNFEVGSSNAVGNDLLQIFDEGIIGMRVGKQKCISNSFCTSLLYSCMSKTCVARGSCACLFISSVEISYALMRLDPINAKLTKPLSSFPACQWRSQTIIQWTEGLHSRKSLHC